MRSILAAVIIIVCFLNQGFSQSGWVKQNSGTNYDIKGIRMTASLGFAVAASPDSVKGLLLKTTDGGQNWQHIDIGNFRPSAFEWFSGSLIIIASNDVSNILRTTDGGMSFFEQLPAGNDKYNGMGIRNTEIFFFAGNNGIYGTANGGDVWDILFQDPGCNMKDIKFSSNSIGVCVGTKCARTTSGGEFWGIIEGMTNFHGAFALSNVVFACGDYDKGIMRSGNSGAAWSTVYTGVPSDTAFYAITGSGSSMFVVGAGGKILRSTNSGLNWSPQVSGVSTSLTEVSIVSGLTGWVAGKNGVILKTITGGLTNVTQTSSEVPEEFSVSQNYPNPFNPETKISFSLPKSSFVKLCVYDASGKIVSDLVNENKLPGSYEVIFNGSSLSSGVYYYKFTSNGFSQTKKMLLVK